MAYTEFDDSKPAGSQTGSAFATSDNANQKALLDMVGAAMMDGFAYSQSGGTAGEPTTVLLTKSTRILKAALTWSGGNITAITFSLSTNSGSSYDTIGSAASFTYDGNGELTATSGWGGIIAKVLPVLGKVKTAITSLAAHIAAIGTAVHGLGTMAIQAATAVAITGGTAILTFCRGKVIALGSISGSTELDWGAGELATVTVTASGAVLTHSNLPTSPKVGTMLVEVVNGGLATNLFSGCLAPGGVKPTLKTSGKDVVGLYCYDGTTPVITGAGGGLASI